MRVVRRGEFLELPEGTLFAKYGGEPSEPNRIEIGELRIKGSNRGSQDWWWLSAVPFPESDDFDGLITVHERLVAGEDLPPDFETVTSDGLYDQDQLFAVFSCADVDALIERLLEARKTAFGR